MKPWRSYTADGFDPDDGLDEKAGRWMYDDERMCQVWVPIKPRLAEKVCVVCETRPVGVRATQCKTCQKRLRDQAQRQAVAA